LMNKNTRHFTCF